MRKCPEFRLQEVEMYPKVIVLQTSISDFMNPDEVGVLYRSFRSRTARTAYSKHSYKRINDHLTAFWRSLPTEPKRL